MRGTAITGTLVEPNNPGAIDEADRKRAALMGAAQAGDRIAYEALLRASIAIIRSVAYRQGVPSDAIDDVVQETLLSVHRARRTYDPSRPFSAWLRTIAHRRAVDVMRHRGYREARELHAPVRYENHPDSSDDPEQALGRADQAARLARAADTLPSGQREAFKSVVLLDQSLDEAAGATRKTAGAIKVNLHRALKTLRARLSGKEGST
jgi:RNA polymerase sigma-70 factor (ECF subfamily)